MAHSWQLPQGWPRLSSARTSEVRLRLRARAAAVIALPFRRKRAVAVMGSAAVLGAVPPEMWSAAEGALGWHPLSLILSAIALYALKHLTMDAADASGKLPAIMDARILEQHVLLDQVIDERLAMVNADTEVAALGIIERVRHLHDSANRLVGYLETSSAQANGLGQEIIASVGYLAQVASFIEELPARRATEANQIEDVARKIQVLAGYVDEVQEVSRYSHLLSINAAIEASRAGDAGSSFQVVAKEVRSLAAKSHAAAANINRGLDGARHAIERSVAASAAQVAEDLRSVSEVSASIKKLQENFDDMSDYYATRFAVVAKHNEDLASDIGGLMGQAQYQDVMRQVVDRVRAVMAERSALLADAAGTSLGDETVVDAVSQALATSLAAYQACDVSHVRAADNGEQTGDGLAIELF